MENHSYEDPREAGMSEDGGSVLSFLILIVVIGWFIMEHM